jgi:hypothetical protein
MSVVFLSREFHDPHARNAAPNAGVNRSFAIGAARRTK